MYFKQQYYKCLEDNYKQISVLEKERKKLFFKVLMLSFFYFCTGLIAAYLFIFIIINDIFNPFLFPVCLFFMYFCFLKCIINFIYENRKFQSRLSKELVPILLKPVANFKNWPVNSNISDLIDSDLFPNFDTREDEFCVFGIYNNTNIIISDTCLKLPVRGLDKPDLFKGKIIQLELNNSFDNHIVFMSKNLKRCVNFKNFKTDVDELNDYLYAYAKTQNNINFVDFAFWEVLKEISKLYLAKSFSLSIKNNIVVIALSQRKFLPCGSLYSSLLNLKNYDDLIDRFIVIFNLIDLFNK